MTVSSQLRRLKAASADLLEPGEALSDVRQQTRFHHRAHLLLLLLRVQ